jgi:hypothetical protein
MAAIGNAHSSYWSGERADAVNARDQQKESILQGETGSSILPRRVRKPTSCMQSGHMREGDSSPRRSDKSPVSMDSSPEQGQEWR